MPPIDWTNVPSHQFERLVGCLLSDLHQARRVDGRGGDGGVDMYFTDERGIHVFECKSFTGRLGRDGGRRTQVERSLRRAAAQSPASWTLIAPIDPTPGEQDWFDGLRSRYEFDLAWFDLTWLEVEVARRPWLRRHFVDNDAERVVDLLRDLNQEQAALAGGAPDAVARVQRVVDLLDETDPFYRYRITSGVGQQRVEVFPRYPGAEDDRPIRFGFRLADEDPVAHETARSALERALAFGEQVELDESVVRDMQIDMPANLGGVFPTGSIRIGAAEPEAIQLRGALAAIDERGQVVAAVPITYLERRAGMRGVVLMGRDVSGLLRVRAAVEEAERKLNLGIELDISEPFLPGEALPAARLAQRLAAPHRLRVTFEGQTAGDLAMDGHAPLAARTVALLEALDRIQTSLGSFFTVPPTITEHDVKNIHLADELLSGRTVDISVPVTEATLEVHDAEGTLVHLRNTTADLTLPVDEFPVRIFGVELDLRPLELTFDEAVIVDGNEVADSGRVVAGASLTVHVTAAEGSSARVRRTLPAPP